MQVEIEKSSPVFYANRIKKILILLQYIKFLEDNCEPTDRLWLRTWNVLKKQYPFDGPVTMNTCQIPNLLNRNNYKRFLKSSDFGISFSLKSLLCMSTKQYNLVRKTYVSERKNNGSC